MLHHPDPHQSDFCDHKWSQSGRQRVAEFTTYIAKYANFDNMSHYQVTQLDHNKDN
jgi:hypothetical protein